jgi:hypothetical protein
MPLNLNNNEVTGVDLNNTEVSEVRLNGQTVFSAVAELQDIVAPGDLVAWYPLDGNVNDETRTGGVLDNAGITVGDSTNYSATNFGVSFQSGGVNDYTNGQYGLFDGNSNIEIFNEGLGSTYIFGTNWSISAWARADENYSSGESYFIVDGGSWERIGFGWNTILAGPGYYNVVISTGDRDIVGADPPYQSANVGTWLHHVFTYDGTMRYYINGVLQGSLAQGTASVEGDFVAIGSNSNETFGAPDYHWEGGIDDVRFYDKVLSGSEINQIYQNTDPN